MDDFTEQTVKYNSCAFPRLNFLQTRLKDFKTLTSSELLLSPHIRFICDKEFVRNLKDYSGQFSVNGLQGECINSTDGELVLTVCIFNVDESGNVITKNILKNEKMLSILRRSGTQVNTVIYVINTSNNDLKLEKCSDEINTLLEASWSGNTIFHRLFTITSSEISLRLSLYFENSLLEKLSKNETISTIRNKKVPDYRQDFRAILRNGPLDINTCKEYLRREAVTMEYPGERVYRMPGKIQTFNNQVNDFLCKSLGRNITLVLKRALTGEIDDRYAKYDFYIYTTSRLTNLMPETIDITNVIELVIKQEVGSFLAPVAFVTAFVNSVDIDDKKVRHDIADKVHERIIMRRDDIIKSVLLKFHDICLDKIEMCDILNAFTKRNTIEISFNECKTVAERNLQIKACGLFGNNINIYISRKADNNVLIKEYLSKYVYMSHVCICEYEEIAITKHSFQSGNKVKLGINSQARYGTVSFPLKDSKSQYYCATCKHVTLESNMYIQTDDGTEIPATLFYSTDDCDFSLVKLQNKEIACSHGIRTDTNTFTSGEILQRDMNPNDDSIVYKWGATTGLTLGKYKGLLCSRKGETKHYEINTYMIEGQHEQFSEEGDSGSLVCIKPDSLIFTKHMAAFVLIGSIKKFDKLKCHNLHACYRVCVALSEMKNSKSCKKIDTCFLCD